MNSLELHKHSFRLEAFLSQSHRHQNGLEIIILKMFNEHFACLGHSEMELYSNDSGLQQGEQNIWEKIP